MNKMKFAEELTASEQDIFIKSIKGHKFESLYLLILTTGLNMKEALSLTWNDIDIENRFIKGMYVIPLKPRAFEGTRYYPIAQQMLNSLPKIDSKNEKIFPFTSMTYEREISRIGKEINLPRITCSLLRRTWLKENGLSDVLSQGSVVGLDAYSKETSIPCEYCEPVKKYGVMLCENTESNIVPENFCPNCGRKL